LEIFDTLHRILENSSKEGFLKGVSLGKNDLQILNLHFSDNTLLFLEATYHKIHVLRWLLIGFENLSGLKINYNKCEMIPLNITEEMGTHLTSLFECKVGHLPITYLGIPLH
jgi:hypothetical protein